MNLLIVLQSHSVTDSQKKLGIIQEHQTRYPGVEKSEISRRCILSLIDSINYLINHTKITVNLLVVDDHSSDAHIATVKSALKNCLAITELRSLSTIGILESLKTCYLYGKEHGKDLVYFAQDDYLYEESCLAEMIGIYEQYADTSIGRSICVYPYNDPYRYQSHNIVPVRIVQGNSRHWRTNYQTACCFMVEHKTIIQEWDLFEAFYQHPVDPKMEDDTINVLFQKREHVLFTPIPSLALHMQYETERDPYIDWKKLWNKYSTPMINLPSKILLNIGSGKTRLNYSSLRNFTEITLDADPDTCPDIVGNIKDLAKLSSKSVDVLWTSHTLEHVHTHEVSDILKNINRIIKDNGLAIIVVPNLKYLAEHVKSGMIHAPLYESSVGPITSLDILYGSVVKVQHGYEYMAHKTGFTKEYATDLLSHLNIAGYIQEADSNLFILITKCPLNNTCVSVDMIMKDFYES